MKITSLAENTSACGLPAEHGLSLFVETDETAFLFDMGQTDLFARNAAALGIDLNAAEFAVLSHGHYDHGGGLAAFLRMNDHAPVYMSCFAFEPHYRGTETYIGLDLSLRASERIVYNRDVTEIRHGYTLFHGGKDRVADTDPAGLYMLRDGKLQPEDFRHEQVLLVQEGGKRVLFSGCSHRGILNIVHWFHPDVLIGGFHLSKMAPDDTLAGYARALDACPAVYYTCHCTGETQYAFMKQWMRDLHYLRTGETVVV